MEQALISGTDIRATFNRRWPVGVSMFLLFMAITTGLALGLPSYFKSRAVILIEAQEMPQDLVRSLVTGFADQRIQVISQRVLTNANLSSIIEKYSLYADQRKSDPLEIVLERMRKDISITPINADVADPKAGRTTQATIAFEVAYENRSPELAQRVANEIVSLFLRENLRQRTETSNETLTFLSTESEKLRERVAELEQRLSDFKGKNVDQLPELNNLNIDLINRTDNDIRSLETQIRSLEQQQVYLESELAQQKPMVGMFSQNGERILGPLDRLNILEAELPSLTARYGEGHPDVVAKKKEIQSLKDVVGEDESSEELELRLKDARAKLGVISKKYSADHPDIKRAQREIAQLETRMASAKEAVPAQPRATRPDNPAYIELQARLEGTKNDLAGLRQQRLELRGKLASLAQRIEKAPEVERVYRSLVRDLESAQAKYQEISAKRQEVEVASNLESEQKGERFTLIEPAATPEQPSKPNRPLIALLGTILSIASGLGIAVLLESTDDRIYGRSSIIGLLGVPPLAIIPTIETELSIRGRRRVAAYFLAGALAFFIVSLILLHIFFRPIDVLWFRLVRAIAG
jgi:succinoglycan biosynthesis transport protein ExoP